MSHFVQKHKYHLILFVILLLTTAISSSYALTSTPKLNSQTIKTESIKPKLQFTDKITASTPNKPLNSTNTVKNTATKNNEIKIQSLPKTDNLASKTNSNLAINTVSTTFYVNNEKYDFKIPPNSTVYDAMKILSQQANFNFNGKNYGSLGFLVEEINGIKNGQQNKYWIYYVNGESAKVGISNYIIKPNDIITWKYIKI